MPRQKSLSPRRLSKNRILMWLVLVLLVGRYTLPIILSFMANQLGVPEMTQRILVEKLQQPIRFSGLSVTPTFTHGVLAGLDNVTFVDPKTGVSLKLARVEAAFPYSRLLSGNTNPDAIRLQEGDIVLNRPKTSSPKRIEQSASLTLGEADETEDSTEPALPAQKRSQGSELPEIELERVHISGQQLANVSLEQVKVGKASVSGIDLDDGAEAKLVKIHLRDIQAIDTQKQTLIQSLSGDIHWEGNIRRIRKKKVPYQLQNVDITATGSNVTKLLALSGSPKVILDKPLPEIHLRLQRFEQVMMGSLRIDNAPEQYITLPDSGKRYPIPLTRLNVQSEATAIIQFKPRKPLIQFNHLTGRLDAETGYLTLNGRALYAKTDFQKTLDSARPLPKQSELTLRVDAWHFPMESLGLLIPKIPETNGIRGIKGAITGRAALALTAKAPEQATLSGDIHLGELSLPPMISGLTAFPTLDDGEADIAFAKTGRSSPLDYHVRNIRLKSGNSELTANYFPGLLPTKPTFSLHSSNLDIGRWQDVAGGLLPVTRRSLSQAVIGELDVSAALLQASGHSIFNTDISVLKPLYVQHTPVRLESGRFVMQGFFQRLDNAHFVAPELSVNLAFSGTTAQPIQQLLVSGNALSTAPIDKSLEAFRHLSIWLPNNWLDSITSQLSGRHLDAKGPFAMGVDLTGTANKPIMTASFDLTHLRLGLREATESHIPVLVFKPFKLFYGLGNAALLTRGDFEQRSGDGNSELPDTHGVEIRLASRQNSLTGWGHLAQTQMSHFIPLLALASPNASSLNRIQGDIAGDFSLSGTLQSPVLSGQFPFRNVGACYAPKSLCVSKWQGQLGLDDTTLIVQEAKGLIDNLPATMRGQFSLRDRQNSQLQIQGERWALSHLLNLLATVSPETKAQFDKLAFQIQSGTVSFDLGLSGPDLSPKAGTIRVQQLHGQYAPAQLIGSIPELVYFIDTGRFQAPNVMLNGQRVQLSGFFLSGKNYGIEGHAKQIAITTLWDSLQKAAPGALPALANRSGEMSLDFKTTPQSTQGLLGLHQVNMASPLLPFPLANINGKIALRNTKGQLQAETNDLRLSYARSPLHISGHTRPGEALSIKADGILSPLLIGQLVPGLNENQPALMGVPFAMSLSQFGDQTKVDLTGTPLEIAPEAANAPIAFTNETIQQAKGRFNAALHLDGETLNLNDITLQHTSGQALTLNGRIDHLFTPEDTVKNLLLKSTPNFELSHLHEIIPVDLLANMQGQITSNLTIHTGSETETAESDGIKTDDFNGELRFNSVSSKPLRIKQLAGSLLFHDREIDWLVSQFKATGIQVAMAAHTPDLNLRPMPIENVQVSGDEFVISLYSEWFRNFQERLVQHPILKRLFPAKKNNNILSFEVTDGQIALKELILNNLILSNFSSQLRLFATSTLEFNDIKADSAGGHVTGSAIFTPKDNNYLSGHFVIDQMQANAVAKVLLGLNNQIFGKLSGTVDFATEGRDLSEQLVYANGVVDFRVQDGRLPAVKKIENMMITANTLAGGIFNLNLNSLFRVLSPIQSDYFAELTGQFQVSNGLLHTENFKSRGTNFNLDIRGNVRLYDAEANLNIKGTVSKRIRGIFGHIGSLSISRLFSFIPPLQRLISFIPGLGYIPGLGRVKDSRGLGFEVDVIGPIYDPASQKNFRWQK